MLGGIIGGWTGTGAVRGAEAGVATEAAIRTIFNYAATSPRIGTLLDYAVKNGVVTLSGEVKSDYKRTRAEMVAHGVPNVKQVVNGIQVVKHRKASSAQ